MNAKGITTSRVQRPPSRVQAHAVPSRSYNGNDAVGSKAAARTLRVITELANAEAEKTPYASVR